MSESTSRLTISNFDLLILARMMRIFINVTQKHHTILLLNRDTRPAHQRQIFAHTGSMHLSSLRAWPPGFSMHRVCTPIRTPFAWWQHQAHDIAHDFDLSTCPADFLEPTSNPNRPVYPTDPVYGHQIATFPQAGNDTARISTWELCPALENTTVFLTADMDMMHAHTMLLAAS